MTREETVLEMIRAMQVGATAVLMTVVALRSSRTVATFTETAETAIPIRATTTATLINGSFTITITVDVVVEMTDVATGTIITVSSNNRGSRKIALLSTEVSVPFLSFLSH
jgi:hypothetical protein